LETLMDRLSKWNDRYRDAAGVPAAARVLLENRHLLPVRGRALDLACGLGGNAQLLAAHGFDTEGWDYAPLAIERFDALAKATGLGPRGVVRDVIAHPPEPDSFDVIVVSHFLERALAPALASALRPEGLLFYQTFTRVRVDGTGPDNPAFRLAENELLTLFRGLRVLVYREEGRTGDTGQGFRNEAMLVAQKV
jgi:SAM-dependent methyltransferase